MYRIAFIILIFSLNASGQTQHKYFIRFADKSGSTYSVNNPEAFLSVRAIERRNANNIPVTEQDLPVNENYIDAISASGARVLTRSKWFNGVTIECDSLILSSVESLPFVLSSSKVFRIGGKSVRKEVTNGVPLNFNTMARVSPADYGDSYNQIHLLNGDCLHNEGFKGEGILMAILDAGFYSVDQSPAFDYIRNNNRILSTWDFVSGDANVYDDATHGMAVLSTIAAMIPGRLTGTAPDATFILLRSEDASSENIIEEYNWASAAEYADSAGADMISNSLGYTLFDDSLTNHTYAEMDGDQCPSTIAADIAASKGMLVISSAGNSGNNPWNYIGAPSDGDSVLSVGAVDSSGRYASFSSYGPASDGDVKPNVMSKGYLSSIADVNGGATRGSGTSFACPILSGMAACLWQQNRTATAMQIKYAIERSASLFAMPNDSMGYGIPDFCFAGYMLSTGTTVLPPSDELRGVFPNPFSENLTMRFYSSVDQDITVEILNSIGQLVSRKSEEASGKFINTFSINSSELSAGIYFLKVTSVEKSFVEIVIKY